MTSEFLDDLFGDQEGIVYSPVKDPLWRQHFFKWPERRDELEKHITNFTDRDVYISPVLFKAPAITEKNFKGTNYLWTEFDGTVPEKDFIEPSMRIQSSNQGHEHWYWRLDSFETDKTYIEDLTRRIAYHYGGDLSVWDYQNVLRVPDTWNYKRNKPVTILSRNDKVYRTDAFAQLPIPPVGTKVEIKLQGLPTREEVLAKYTFKEDTLDLLFKEIKQGSRSTALARLAFDAIEAGCSNEEAYVLLEERDTAWGKYVGRSDRDKQLKACISHARGKISSRADVELRAPEVYRFSDFLHTDIKLEWVIPGLLPVAGTMLILGKEGLGKSTFSLRMASSLALGKDKFLNWDIKKRQRTLFVSLEMQHGELKEFLTDMRFTQEEEAELQEWLHIWPIGHAYPFDIPDHQPELLKYVDMFGIELVIIDSLGLSTYGDITDNATIKRLNAYLNEDVRKKRKCGYVFIHHLRKGGIDDLKKVAEIDDSFGSRYITTNSQTIVILSQKPGSPRLHIAIPKTRMTIGAKEFDVERTPDRGFKLAGSHDTPSTDRVEKGSDKVADANSLGKLLNL
jgi:KaiC/GvpD/RAD55 family RecA-like ATPase